MDEDTTELENSLLKWVNTFVLSKDCKTLEELCDGVLLTEIFSQIAGSSYVDLSLLKRDCSSNYLLKNSNLKALYSNLRQFYVSELSLPFPTSPTSSSLPAVDVELIGRSENITELVKLLEIILGAAIECENKNEYISNIMLLDNEAKMALKDLIQKLLVEHQEQLSAQNNSMPDLHTSSLSSDLDGDELTKSQLKQYHHELQDLQLEFSVLQSENANIRSEREGLYSAVKNLEQALESSEKQLKFLQKESEKQNQTLTLQGPSITEEQWKMATEEIERLESDNEILQKKNEENSKQLISIRKLKDEVDLWKEKNEKFEKANKQLENWKGKIDQLEDAQNLNNELTEQNEILEKTNQELKETVEMLEKSKPKSQVNNPGNSPAGGWAEWREEKKKLEGKFKEESAIKESELKILTTEKESLENEIRNLKMKLEQQENDENFGEHEINAENAEKLSVLEKENELLKKQLEEAKQVETENENGTGGEKLELANTQIGTLTTQIETLKAQIESLKQEAETPREIPSANNTEELEEAKKQVDILLKEKEKLEEDNKGNVAELEKQIELLSKELADSKQREGQTKEVTVVGGGEELELAKKQVESLASDKARLEGYLRTAKTMIRELRNKKDNLEDISKMKEQHESEIEALKRKLVEKESTENHLKNVMGESKDATEREQKLLVTAFYDLGLEMARRSVTKPEDVSEEPQSFLAGLRKTRTGK